MNTHPKHNKSESGLAWGFEVESLALEIIADADEILEENLLDLLMQRTELITLLAKFAEFVQKIPEIKKITKSQSKLPRNTVRDELKILLNDLTDGAYHCVYQNGAHRKLDKRIEQKGDNQRIFIRRITDDYVLK